MRSGYLFGNKRDGNGSDHVLQLGAFRLAIFEKCSKANSGDFGIVFDGRIFNSRQLSFQLDLENASDPELLISAYRKWGIGFPQHLEGEFAFALWDRLTFRVILGCGIGGTFPLYYGQRNEDFFFARALRDLVTEMGIPPHINENYVARWLTLTSVESDSTFFENVFRMVPGSILVFEQGRISRELYWRPEDINQVHLTDSHEYAERLTDVMKLAIKDRLTKSSSVGTMLSGGLDSSTMTSLTAEILRNENRRLFAFTSVPSRSIANFCGRFGNEGPAAESIAAMFPNIDHVLVQNGRHSVFSLMDLFSSRQLEPVANPPNYDWLYEICLQARNREVDTLFTGESGNLSVSYNGFYALRSLAMERRFFEIVKLSGDMVRNGYRTWRNIANELFGLFIPIKVRSFLIRALFKKSSDSPGDPIIRREFAQSQGLGPEAYDRFLEGRHVNSMRVLLLRRPEVPSIDEAFRQVTGVSRIDPFMDRRVIEFCLSVPLEYYSEKGLPRSLIRNAMKGRLPEQVLNERRRGLQAADFYFHFKREREEAFAELARLKKVDSIVRILDLEKLEKMMNWSKEQIMRHGGMPGHWTKLLRFFSLGRFLRRVEDRSLFFEYDKFSSVQS
ncbi:MAG: hypothetical protein HQM08_24465 [Candidatus Riflebacteria bacterium]|nr:hypothetical protein [Candidatus Riflebacteria bacterium]